jgi:hypothetical protein
MHGASLLRGFFVGGMIPSGLAKAHSGLSIITSKRRISGLDLWTLAL